MTPSRRAEHAADTRAALLGAARALFAERGYAATGTEDVVAAARVTRGALYHHFRDKAALFGAVVEQVGAELAERLIRQQLDRPAAGGPLAQIRDGLAAFLDTCVDSDFQRLVLVEGPIVLGADAWNDLAERHGLRLLTEWLGRAMDAGELDRQPPEVLARLIVAMIIEASLVIARADDQAAARVEVGAVLDRTLRGLQPA
ncbi:TetR/AcrR family transcriptional regulator [Actinomadura sp. NPDC048394]|jgi:AcrR family transcriptional regulator|uniref:TetR/AcrR family transcriptional regulator n=1 Tax=Actinomadura sp. NPDC048394 TaxID=3158223 RepID=UPI0033F41673